MSTAQASNDSSPLTQLVVTFVGEEIAKWDRDSAALVYAFDAEKKSRLNQDVGAVSFRETICLEPLSTHIQAFSPKNVPGCLRVLARSLLATALTEATRRGEHIDIYDLVVSNIYTLTCTMVYYPQPRREQDVPLEKLTIGDNTK